jgi:hypothetical protein
MRRRQLKKWEINLEHKTFTYVKTPTPKINIENNFIKAQNVSAWTYELMIAEMIAKRKKVVLVVVRKELTFYNKKKHCINLTLCFWFCKTESSSWMYV